MRKSIRAEERKRKEILILHTPGTFGPSSAIASFLQFIVASEKKTFNTDSVCREQTRTFDDKPGQRVVKF